MSAFYECVVDAKDDSGVPDRLLVQANDPFCSRSTDRSPTELLLLAESHRLLQPDAKGPGYWEVNVRHLLENCTVWAISHTNGELL